jgi:hypothetical protein
VQVCYSENKESHHESHLFQCKIPLMWSSGQVTWEFTPVRDFLAGSKLFVKVQEAGKKSGIEPMI